MDKLKILFQQTLMISTGILFVIGVEGLVSHLTGRNFEIEWYYPFSIILTGVLCSIPSLLLMMWAEESSKRRFLLQVFLHCLVILAIVSIVGWIFNWYSTLVQYLVVVIAYFVVYVFVWVATIWIHKDEENKINNALKNIQDEE